MIHSKEYDFLVFIGRFQPVHRGHLAVIETALEKANRVIVLAGSSNSTRSLRNPFTFSERAKMILGCFDNAERKRIIITSLNDITYNDQEWIAQVQASVQGIVCQYHVSDTGTNAKIGLIGHAKDHTSYYLKLFPQWGSVDVHSVEQHNSTDIRKQYLENSGCNWNKNYNPFDHIHPHTYHCMEKFRLSEQTCLQYQHLCDEADFVAKYQSAWANAPYPPTFVTVDAVVVQSGHVLLVERGARPGKGLLALPGGFVNQDEKLRHAMLRELREETRLKIPAPVLEGSIKATDVFDDPHRSSRGRTITHAFLIELKPDLNGLPPVKGGDDAAKAKWVAIADLKPDQLFEDHWHIIQAMLGRL